MRTVFQMTSARPLGVQQWNAPHLSAHCRVGVEQDRQASARNLRRRPRPVVSFVGHPNPAHGNRFTATAVISGDHSGFDCVCAASRAATLASRAGEWQYDGRPGPVLPARRAACAAARDAGRRRAGRLGCDRHCGVDAGPGTECAGREILAPQPVRGTPHAVHSACVEERAELMRPMGPRGRRGRDRRSGAVGGHAGQGGDRGRTAPGRSRAAHWAPGWRRSRMHGTRKLGRSRTISGPLN